MDTRTMPANTDTASPATPYPTAPRRPATSKADRDAARARNAARQAAIDTRPATRCDHTPKHTHGTALAYTACPCRCRPCTNAKSDRDRTYRRTRAYGRPTTDLVPAGKVRAHLNQLRATGMGQRAIRDASGVSRTGLRHILQNPRRRVSPATEAALLAVVPALSASALIDATPARRRVQALAHAGWCFALQGAAYGLTARSLHALMHQPTVKVSVAAAIIGEYERLLATPPPAGTPQQKRAVGIARGNAARHHWHPDSAWDDIDTDGTPTPLTRARGVDVDDVVHHVEQGADWAELIDRFDVSRDGLLGALRRADRTDVLATLHRRAIARGAAA